MPAMKNLLLVFADQMRGLLSRRCRSGDGNKTAVDGTK